MKTSWYVVQIQTGREDKMAHLLERAVSHTILSEAFSPLYWTQVKVHGEWINVKRRLLPGYLIVLTKDVDALRTSLSAIPEFTKVLVTGEQYVPLTRAEVEVIDRFTHPGERTVPMSMGFIEGDHVVVTDGPLKGHEAMIKGFNRRKSLAFLELRGFGRKITTTVGLGLVTRVQEDALGSIDGSE